MAKDLFSPVKSLSKMPRPQRSTPRHQTRRYLSVVKTFV